MQDLLGQWSTDCFPALWSLYFVPRVCFCPSRLSSLSEPHQSHCQGKNLIADKNHLDCVFLFLSIVKDDCSVCYTHLSYTHWQCSSSSSSCPSTYMISNAGNLRRQSRERWEAWVAAKLCFLIVPFILSIHFFLGCPHTYPNVLKMYAHAAGCSRFLCIKCPNQLTLWFSM